MPDSQPPTRRTIWVDLLLYPGHTLPTAAAPILVAGGLAIHNHTLAALPLLLCFLASWLVHVGGVLTDNLVLITRHGDVPEHPELLAARANGSLPPRRLLLVTIACLLAAFATGPWLYAIGGGPAVLLAVVGVVASLAYSIGGPVSLTRLGVADVVFFLMFGSVAIAGSYYVQMAAHDASGATWSLVPQIPLSAWLVGMPVGAIITNVLLIDDIRDRAYDAKKGWRTAPVRFGLAWTRNEFTLLMAFAYLAPLAFWLWLGFGPFALLPWLTAPAALKVTKIVRTSERFEDLHPMTPRTSRLSLEYALLLATGLAI